MFMTNVYWTAHDVFLYDVVENTPALWRIYVDLIFYLFPDEGRRT